MEMPVIIKRSKRKTISLSVTPQLEVLVRAPLGVSDQMVHDVVGKHSSWLEKQMAKEQERQTRQRHFTPEEVKELKAKAAQLVGQRVAYFSELMQLKPTGVKITSAAARWGSCSGRNSLCFSYRIALLPPDLMDYIVVHELAHIKIKDHSPRFYAVVQRYLPDYQERVARLRTAGRELGL